MSREASNAVDGTGFAGVRGASPLPHRVRIVLQYHEQGSSALAKPLLSMIGMCPRKGTQRYQIAEVSYFFVSHFLRKRIA